MFKRRSAERYDEALDACSIATKRLKCINRELAKADGNGLTPRIRQEVTKAFRHHLVNCEGLTTDTEPQLQMTLTE